MDESSDTNDSNDTKSDTSNSSNELIIDVPNDSDSEETTEQMMCAKCHSTDIITVSDNTWSDHYYFKMYDSSQIHETMLKDRSRTNAYYNAIMENKQFFRDKIVLDVGCGTGILCLLAVKAGAKHVIGIDNSNIIEVAKKIVADNEMQDSK